MDPNVKNKTLCDGKDGLCDKCIDKLVEYLTKEEDPIIGPGDECYVEFKDRAFRLECLR